MFYTSSTNNCRVLFPTYPHSQSNIQNNRQNNSLTQGPHQVLLTEALPLGIWNHHRLLFLHPLLNCHRQRHVFDSPTMYGRCVAVALGGRTGRRKFSIDTWRWNKSGSKCHNVHVVHPSMWRHAPCDQKKRRPRSISKTKE